MVTVRFQSQELQAMPLRMRHMGLDAVCRVVIASSTRLRFVVSRLNGLLRNIVIISSSNAMRPLTPWRVDVMSRFLMSS